MTTQDDALVEAVALAIAFEGFSAKPYRCPAGVWSIGYGSTHDAAYLPIGPNTPPITPAQGKALMERDMRNAMATIEVGVQVPLNPVQEGALMDFVYNVGMGAFRTSTMLRKLNAGDYHGAAAELDRWVYGGGKVLAGLVRRRAAERAAFEGR